MSASSGPALLRANSFERRSFWQSAFAAVLFLLSLCIGFTQLAAQTPTPVPVTTWRYDNQEMGQNTHETALTPSNVNGSSFGKLFSHTLDGAVYAQPLYLPALTMKDGLVHNVLFVATEHDSIYAFDADSNTGANANPLWQVTLLDAAHGAASGATPVPSTAANTSDISPEIGITSTPVIDTSTNTMYVVGKTAESGTYVQRLHALDVFTGAEKRAPVVIAATVNGTGDGSVNGKLSFIALRENQRSALMLFNGHVYIAFGSHGDHSPYHGWLLAYDASTLAQTAALCMSPNGYGDSIWASGAGMPIDPNVPGGKMFLVTGNGTFANYPPFTNGEFGDSIVAISLANGGLTPVDAFTPFDEAHLSSADLDQGSAGVLMLPDQQGAYPHILLQGGKEGRLLVLNRDSLGGYAAGATYNSNALQDITGQVKGLWSTPAYWNGNVYTWGSGDYGSYGPPKLFKLNSGVLNTTASSAGSMSAGYPGGIFSVSSNGTSNGIAWALRTDGFTGHTDQILYAFDANDLSKLLYASSDNSTRDSPGPAMKFAIPVVTNGKVYVSALKRITVYGLFNGPVAATPIITPNGGTFSSSQSVTITTSTSSASIYYTLDGTSPTPASPLYTGPLTISSNTTLRAIASAPGFVQSATASATFTFSNETPNVVISPAGGTYSSAESVTLMDTDANAAIHYTTDGSTPTASSPLYTAALTVSASETIRAIAIDPSLSNSTVTSASFVIQAGGGTTVINFGNGFTSTNGLTLNGTAVNTNDTKLALTTGATGQAGSIFFSTPVGVQTFTTDFAFQQTNAVADGMTFTVQNVGRTALGGGYAGLGYANLGKSAAIKFDLYNNAGEGTDSTGLFTDGALPTVPALDMTSSGVVLRSGDVMQAHVAYDGTTLTMNLTDTVQNKTYTLSKPVNIPQLVGGNTAYVGFTGSTGGATSTQKLLRWTYSTQTSTPPPPPPPPSSINFTSGFASSSGLSLKGSAAVASNVLRLTQAGVTYSSAAAWFAQPVRIGSFTTDFNFQLLNAVADGLTFTIQNAGATAIGPGGSGLGYGASQPNGTGGIPHSVAVKFDVYSNDGEGTDSTGFYSNGASPTIPAVNMSGSGVLLRSGHVLHAHITYNGTNLTLLLTDTATSATFTTTTAINIPSIIGASTAYVGFTGGTGGATMTSNILNWTLTNP